MNRQILSAVMVGLSLSLFSVTATAQESGATITVTPLSVKGFVKGNRHVFDADFAAEHGVAVPAPFNFIAPTSKEHLNFIKPAPGGIGIFKIFFTTLDKAVKSNLQFVPLRVDMGPVDQRLKIMQNILRKGFISSVPDPDRAEISLTRATKVGPYDALELIGRYDGGADGVIVLRVVGILNPDGENGLFVIINAVIKDTEMKSVEDVLKTDASRALGTMRFQ